MSKWKTIEPGKIPTSMGLKLEIPRIDPKTLNDPNRLDEVVELKLAGVGQIQESINNALEWLASVTVWLAQNQPASGDSPEAKTRKAMKLRIAKQEIAKDEQKVREYIDECLNAEEPIYKISAVVAYLNHTFEKEVSSHEEASEMLNDLEQKMLLVKKSNGPIMIGYQRYDVSEKFGLQPEDLEEIKTAISKFSRTVLQFTAQERERETAAIQKESNLNLDQFLNGVQGRFLLEIPAESYIQGGEERWRGGGNLLLSVVGGNIIPLTSTGSIEKMVANIVELGVRLPHYTLKWERPPGSGEKAFNRVKEGILNTQDVSEEEAEILVKKTQALWYLVIRGINATKQQEELNKLRDFYQENSTVSAEEFFGLNDSPKDGSAYLEFEGAFKNGNDTFYNVFLLIERSRQGNTTYLEVLAAPGHVESLLGRICMNGTMEEGDDFMKLPSNLRRLLRAIRSKTDLKMEVSKK